MLKIYEIKPLYWENPRKSEKLLIYILKRFKDINLLKD